MIKLISTLLMLHFLSACTNDAKTPEGLLNKFVVDITTKKLDREYFEEYTTGKVLENIEQLNQDEFEKFSNLSDIKEPKIDVIKKVCSDKYCTLTYIIKYSQHIKQKKEFNSEVKKVATLEKEGDTWKISEVSNLKTYHEAVNPIKVE